jgi:hypothetical protein
VRPNRRNSLLILGAACFALALGTSAGQSTWPLWARGALWVSVLVLFPLLNSLGVFETLGVKSLPGFQWRPRWMFMAIPLLIAAGAWAFFGARWAPDTTVGAWLVLGPAFCLGFGALFCLFKGTR